MFDGAQHVSLGLSVLDDVLGHDFALVEDLHGELLACFLQGGEIYFAKSSLTKNCLNFERLWS